MLIRIVNHPVNNNFLCDKMIFIEGLPDNVFFQERNGKKYLKEPWLIDVTANIPSYVRMVLQPEPFKINVYTPSPEKGLPAIDEEVDAYGISVDYQNGRGEEAWKNIERFIDKETPRGEAIPEPVVVATIDDEHRDSPFSVPVEEIPFVKLGEKADKDKPVLIKSTSTSSRRCPVCSKSFERDKGIAMHYRKTGHKPSQVPVGV